MDCTILIRAERGARIPEYKTKDAAGADICARIDAPRVIHPGERYLVPTGLFMEIEPGFEVQVRPRSGLALKHGITVLNTPGTIDADYRGEIGVLLINLGDAPWTLTDGERIAQMVAAPVTRAVFRVADSLSRTARGTGGYGSTGTH